MGRYISLLSFCVVVGCQSNPGRAVHNLHWVYGSPFPFLAPIKQTNFEIEFWNSSDSMILGGLRDQLRGKTSVSIEPITMWTVFSYPPNTGLAISTTILQDMHEMSGWVLDPDGAFRNSNHTNKVHDVLARQTGTGASEPSAKLTMLLKVEHAGSTNLTEAVLSCVWRNGALENRGLRLTKESIKDRANWRVR
jgi:hypothetical protein